MNDSKRSGCDCKHIKGIECSVKNCAYHNGDCYCTADHINVAPANAKTSGETACATFRPEGTL